MTTHIWIIQGWIHKFQGLAEDHTHQKTMLGLADISVLAGLVLGGDSQGVVEENRGKPEEVMGFIPWS